MPASDRLSDVFVASVKRRANIPLSPDGWTAADVLEMATEEMRDSIVPMLRRLAEEHLVYDDDQNIVANAAEYDLPDWATGEALRDVQLLDAGRYVPLTRVQPESATGLVGPVGGYYLRDNKVALVPTPTAALASGLRLRCIRRPSKLVELDQAFSVSSASADEATVASLDGDGDTAAAVLGSSASVDVLKVGPGFRVLGSGLSVECVGNTVTFIDGDIADLAPGFVAAAYIVATDRSPGPQIPDDLHGLLAQMTACAFIRAANGAGLAEAETKKKEMWAEAVSLYTPRTQNQAKRVINRHGAGMRGVRIKGV